MNRDHYIVTEEQRGGSFKATCKCGISSAFVWRDSWYETRVRAALDLRDKHNALAADGRRFA